MTNLCPPFVPVNYAERAGHYLQVANAWLGNNVSIEALIALPALLLALLVPIAIFMIDKKSVGFTWDKAAILTKVLNAKLLFIGLVIMAVNPLLWGISHARVVIIALTVAALVVLIMAIVSSYRWLIVSEPKGASYDNYRTRKRLDYLRSLDDEQKAVIWSLTWSIDRSSRALIDERELVKIFVANLNSLGDKQNSGPNIVRDFMTNLDQIDLTDPVIHETLVGFCMQWASSLAHPEKKEKSMLHFQMTTRRLFFDILKRDLPDPFQCYLLYNDTRTYLKNNKLSEEYFVKYFSVEFLSGLRDLKDADHIWDEFPREWLITIENLDNKDTNKVTLGWLTAYMRWISSRNLLVSTKDARYEEDFLADSVTSHLLPTIEPRMWADLIAFHWSPYGVSDNETSEHAQIRGFVERQKRFGSVGRTYGFWEDDGKGSVEARFKQEYDKNLEETVNMATRTTIFPLLIHEASLQKVLAEFGNFKYSKGSLEEDKLTRLKHGLERIQTAQAAANAKLKKKAPKPSGTK